MIRYFKLARGMAGAFCLLNIGICLFFGICFLGFPVSVDALANNGATFYDSGMFSLESGDYESAKKQLLRATEIEPNNPYYRHALGKLYLKTDRFEASAAQLQKAMARDPGIPGLKFDLAMAFFNLEDYESAAGLFAEAADANPDNALARYHAGISCYKLKRFDEASGHLNRAAQDSPSLRPHCRYVVGVCHYKTGRPKEALNMFAQVADDPEAGELGDKAKEWISAILAKEGKFSDWRIYAKLGRRYDDNVRLDPLDRDLGGDESDSLIVFYFSGDYRFLKKEKFNAGAGYAHYMTLHDDLEEFDLMGSILKAYADYRTGPFTFRMSALPSYYWLDSDSYLRRYEIKPEAFWKATDLITAHLALRYNNDKDMSDDGRSGDLGGVFLDARLKIPAISGRLFGGAGWKTFNANREDESWNEWMAKAGVSVDLPMDINLSSAAEYAERKYDIEAGCECDRRDDRKWSGNLSLSRHIVYKWLRAIGEYEFTKQGSNYVNKQYERNKITVSMAVQF